VYHTAGRSRTNSPERVGLDSYYAAVWLGEEFAVKKSGKSDPTIIYLRWCKDIQDGLIQSDYKHAPLIHCLIEHDKGYYVVLKKYKKAKERPVGHILEMLKPFTAYLEQQGLPLAMNQKNGYVVPIGKQVKTFGFFFRYDLHSENYMVDPDDGRLVITDPLAGNYHEPSVYDLPLFKPGQRV